MPSGAVSLSAYPGDVVVLAWAKCGRRGEYRKSRLIAEHGDAIGLPELRARLAKDCRLITAHVGNETCGAVYPELALSGN